MNLKEKKKKKRETNPQKEKKCHRYYDQNLVGSFILTFTVLNELSSAIWPTHKVYTINFERVVFTNNNKLLSNKLSTLHFVKIIIIRHRYQTLMQLNYNNKTITLSIHYAFLQYQEYDLPILIIIL